MAKFKFNLQGVLRQRKLVEDQRQREFGEVQRQYAAMEAELRAMDETMRAATDDLRQNQLIGRIDLGYLAAHRRFAMGMQRKAMDHAQRMAQVRVQLDAARNALVEAAKQRKVIDKLKENRQTAWKDDQQRRDTAATDEVAQQIGVRLARSVAAEDQRLADGIHAASTAEADDDRDEQTGPQS